MVETPRKGSLDINILNFTIRFGALASIVTLFSRLFTPGSSSVSQAPPDIATPAPTAQVQPADPFQVNVMKQFPYNDFLSANHITVPVTNLLKAIYQNIKELELAGYTRGLIQQRIDDQTQRLSVEFGFKPEMVDKTMLYLTAKAEGRFLDKDVQKVFSTPTR